VSVIPVWSTGEKVRRERRWTSAGEAPPLLSSLHRTPARRTCDSPTPLDSCSSRAYTSDLDELLAAILGAIAELLLEAFMELIAAAVLDLASRALLDVFTGLTDAIKENKILTGFMYGLLGVLAGVLSLLVLPHRLIHREHPIGFHGISLLISPIIAGAVLSSVGAAMRRRGKKVTPVETFGYGFAFALGMALVRFLFAK
jgi:hypothetical protein